MNDEESLPSIENLQKKYELIRREVQELNNGTNNAYIQYIERFTQYSEKRKEDLEKWRENEITYVEDEKERSITCCDSDCESYLAQIDTRYKMYLKFKLETLKRYFPQQFQYYEKQNIDIINDLSKIPSVTDDRASTTSIEFSDKPLLSPEDIKQDLESIPTPPKVTVKKDSITIGHKTYKIGDHIPIPSANGSSAQLFFTHPQISLLIDDELFKISLERFEQLLDII